MIEIGIIAYFDLQVNKSPKDLDNVTARYHDQELPYPSKVMLTFPTEERETLFRLKYPEYIL
jgi:hypothetical protein